MAALSLRRDILGMIAVFIHGDEDGGMARRTISLPKCVEDLARESAREGESFSATVARLIEQGARVERGGRSPRYVAAGEGPEDLGRAAERYLSELVEAR
jgi:hypothetical protein